MNCQWSAILLATLAACGQSADVHHPRSAPPASTPATATAPKPRSEAPAPKDKPKVEVNRCSADRPKAPELAKIEGQSITMAEKVFFKSGSAEIDNRSDKLLQNVAAVLQQHPDIDFVEVAGHADSRGSEAQNKKLTADRAKAVMDRLVTLGVADVRLRANGYAHFCPVDPATNDAAYEKNRRVDLNILRRGGTDTGTAWGGCDEATKKGMTPAPIPASAPAYSAELGKPTKGADIDRRCEPPLTKEAKKLTTKEVLLDGKELPRLNCLGGCDDKLQIELAKSRAGKPGHICKALASKDPVEIQNAYHRQASALYEAADFSPIGSKERLELRQRAMAAYQASLGFSSQQTAQSAQARLGILLRRSGMFDEAIAFHRKALADDCTDDNRAYAHLWLGYAIYMSGPDDEAKRAAADKELVAAEAVPDAKFSIATVWLLRANIADKRGKRDEAKALFQKVIAFNKEQRDAYKLEWHWTDPHLPDRASK